MDVHLFSSDVPLTRGTVIWLLQAYLHWRSLLLEGRPGRTFHEEVGSPLVDDRRLNLRGLGSGTIGCRGFGVLEKLGWRSDMTEELHCYENAMSERLNGILNSTRTSRRRRRRSRRSRTPSASTTRSGFTRSWGSKRPRHSAKSRWDKQRESDGGHLPPGEGETTFQGVHQCFNRINQPSRTRC